MKASVKNERKSLEREAAKQQLLYISYERQWQSQIRALTGAPRLEMVLTATTQLIILNYPCILSHQGSTTVSLETYPLYSFIIIKSQLEFKTTTKTTMIHKGWPNVTLHLILGTEVITCTQHANTSNRMPIVLVTFTYSSEKYIHM